MGDSRMELGAAAPKSSDATRFGDWLEIGRITWKAKDHSAHAKAASVVEEWHLEHRRVLGHLHERLGGHARLLRADAHELAHHLNRIDGVAAHVDEKLLRFGVERDAPPKRSIQAGRSEARSQSPGLATVEVALGTSQHERAERLAAMREALTLQYQKPVLPVPQGASVEGRVVAVFGGEEPDRMRVVVVGERAVHIVGVGADTARETLGKRVTVANERGRLTLSPHEVDVRVDVGNLHSLVERKALDAGTAATFAPSHERAQRAIGAETAYRDVLTDLDHLLSQGRTAPVVARERGR